MMKYNEIIEYFCLALPDRHNLLAWEAIMYRGGEVFKHPEGFLYQVIVFEHGGAFPMHHVMVIGVN